MMTSPKSSLRFKRRAFAAISETVLLGESSTKRGDWLISALVALFSVAFPAAKLLVLHIAAHSPDKMRWVERVSILSKWSMADVLIVALAIFAAKTSGLAAAATQAGIWFYAGATLLSAITAILLTRQADSSDRSIEEISR